MKILFIYQSLISFVEKDRDILKEENEIREICFNSIVDIYTLIKNIIWCDITFSWFGKLHAFFAVLFSKLLLKKAIVVAGGDDVANETDINYGMFAYWWKKWCPLFVFKQADLVLAVSQYNLRETIENARAKQRKVKLLYHGFDEIKFGLMPGIEKKQVVITVGGVDWERLVRKGYERFVRCAAYLPAVKFVLIGQWHDYSIDHLRKLAPDNVIFTGRVSDMELLKWFSQAKVYVQVSMHEAFGCSLAEAMLCECVPVVSRNAALPEVVGNCGFYVDELTPEVEAVQIEKALASDLGESARERIVRKFPLEKRRKSLLYAINNTISK